MQLDESIVTVAMECQKSYENLIINFKRGALMIF